MIMHNKNQPTIIGWFFAFLPHILSLYSGSSVTQQGRDIHEKDPDDFYDCTDAVWMQPGK